MAQEQNYQVNYTINVDATAGTKQVMAFADSVSALNIAEITDKPANCKTPPPEISKLSSGEVYNLFDCLFYLLI